MLTILAQTDAGGLNLSVIVQSLTALCMLAVLILQLARGATGRDQDRNIQPTALHAIQNELKTQTQTLNKIDREMGSVQTTVTALEKQMDGMHHRVGSISRDLAGTTARVDNLEKLRRSANA